MTKRHHAAELRIWKLILALGAALLVQGAGPTTSARPLQIAPDQPQWRFEPNRGQSASGVRFLARGPGYTLFLTDTEALFRFSDEPDGEVLMHWLGANPAPRIEGLETLPGTSHYLRGNDPAQWVHGVEAYSRIAYRDLYPGVDLVFYGRGSDLEYDLVVAPGADPNAVELAYSAPEAPVLQPGGDLQLQLPHGRLVQHPPVAYQDEAGSRRPVEARVSLGEAGRFRVALGAYEPARTLIVDPILSYATYLGGTADDLGRSVAVDTAGHLYVAGSTESVDFPGASAPPGALDAFVAKLDAVSGQLVYATYLGGSAKDLARGIAADAAGFTYITGQTQSADFPVVNAAGSSWSGNYDAFVAKLNPTGSALVYSRYVGGSGFDAARGIAVDEGGQAAVMGQTLSADFPTFNAIQDTPGGEIDAFVLKLDAGGSSFVFSTYHGGSGEDLPFTDGPVTDPPTSPGYGLALDHEGAVYVAGTTESLDFPTANAFQANNGGGRDGFVSKFDPTGSSLVYSTYIGRINGDTARDVAADRFGNAYVTGGSRSVDFPTTEGSVQPVIAGSYDAFALKLDPSGTQLLYSTFLGGTGNEGGNAIEVDDAGNAHVFGHTRSTDFPTANAIQPSFGGGVLDLFLTKLDPTASSLLYSTYLGGSDWETPLQDNMGLALDPLGDAAVAAATSSSDFPTLDPAQGTLGGGFDAFVARLRTAPRIELRIEDVAGTNHLIVTAENPGANPRQVELKLWAEGQALGEEPLSFLPGPKLIQLPPGAPVEIGNLTLPGLLSFPGTVVRGRLLDPKTGVRFDESACSTLPCP